MPYEIFVKQLDGCTYKAGGFNCTTAAHAMWLYRASQGKIKTTSCAIRTKTGDKSGGTNLSQMEQISIALGITNGRVYRPTQWSTLTSIIGTKRYGSHLSISYRRLSGTKYDCFSGNFKGNHALYISGPGSVAGTWRVGDPGADDRRSGIPNGYQNIPISLLKSAAGDLDLGGRKLGFGLAYAYATPPDPATSAPMYKATVSVATPLWNNGSQKWVYTTDPIDVGTPLIIRAAKYSKGGKDCYPIDASSPNYPNYFIPMNTVKLGVRV